MPTIPIIQQTTQTPNGSLSARASASDFGGNIGSGIESVGKGANNLFHGLERMHEQDAKMYAGQIASDANAQFEKRLAEMKSKAEPGAPEFTPTLMKEFKDYSSKAIEAAPTPSSKHFVQQHMMSLQNSLQSSAIAFEAGARVSLRTDTFQKSADNWAQVVAANPTEEKIAGALSTLRETMPDVGPDGKSRLNEYAEKTIRTAAWASLAQNNPALAKRVIDGAFGKMQTAVSPQTAGKVPEASLKAVEKFAPIIDQASAATGVDATFLRRQLAVESGGNPDAINNSDIRVTGKPSIGIAQFQPDTAKQYGIDPTKPDQAIYGQSRYMADLLKMFGGDYAKAAAGYNWGQGNVQKVIAKWGDKWADHIPASTKDYLAKIGTPMEKHTLPPNEKPQGFSGVVGMTPISELLHWQNQAEQQLNRVSQDQQTQLRLDTQNAEAQARAGIAPTGPNKTAGDFLAAFKDPVVAQTEFARYSQARNTATAVAGMQGRSSAELLSIASAKSSVNPEDENFAVSSSNEAIRQNAAASILKARSQDPWQYAMEQGQFSTKPADFGSKEFPDVLRSRAASLPGMMQQYGTGPVLLTDAERKNLTARLNGLPADQRVDLLKQIRGSVGDDVVYGTLMQSIRPDSPVTALAGSIAGLGGSVKIGSGNLSTDEVARRIAIGEDLLNKTKGDKQSDGGKGSGFPMPKDQLLQTEFNDAVGSAYAGFPAAYAHAYEAYRAYYASQLASLGKMNPAEGVDSTIAKEAIDAATGGLTKWGSNSWGFGGSKLILPYGMPADKFKDAVAQQWGQLAQENGLTKTGVNDIGLSPTGVNGRYRVMSGASWVPDKDGNPLIIDVLGKK